MKSKGHFIASLIKSIIRIIGGLWAIRVNDWQIFACAMIIAEGFGIFEELRDERG